MKSNIQKTITATSFAQHNVVARGVMMVVVTLLAACGGSKEKAPSQSLAQVNGSDITVLQMNEELARSKIPIAQKEAATKQLLEALIDRQLLQNEALRDKVDRDPQVVQAIERAKSQILTQAYLQKRLANVAKPGKADIETYYNTHPEIFAQSKIYALHELIIATADVNGELSALLAKAASLEEIATWMQVHKVQFTHNQLTRNAVDLPPPLLKKLQEMRKGQLFTVTEGDRSVVVELFDTRDNPVALNAAAAQIDQYLINEKNKVAAEAEVARLRANAKIVYLNQVDKVDKAEASVKPTTIVGQIAPAGNVPAQTSVASTATNATAATNATIAKVATPAPVSTSTSTSTSTVTATSDSAPSATTVTEDQIKRGVAGLR